MCCERSNGLGNTAWGSGRGKIKKGEKATKQQKAKKWANLYYSPIYRLILAGEVLALRLARFFCFHFLRLCMRSFHSWASVYDSTYSPPTVKPSVSPRTPQSLPQNSSLGALLSLSLSRARSQSRCTHPDEALLHSQRQVCTRARGLIKGAQSKLRTFFCTTRNTGTRVACVPVRDNLKKK